MSALRRALALLVAVLAGCDQLRPFHGTTLHPAEKAPPLVLTDGDGRRFDLAAERGRPVLVAFGYAHCADVCITTLADWRRVRERLGDRAGGVRFVFVSVDPGRDTPADVAAFARQFDSSFVGLSGTAAEIDGVATAWKVAAYPASAAGAPGHYAVAHPGQAFLVDPKGRLRVIYPSGASVAAIAADLRRWL